MTCAKQNEKNLMIMIPLVCFFFSIYAIVFFVLYYILCYNIHFILFHAIIYYISFFVFKEPSRFTKKDDAFLFSLKTHRLSLMLKLNNNRSIHNLNCSIIRVGWHPGYFWAVFEFRFVFHFGRPPSAPGFHKITPGIIV